MLVQELETNIIMEAQRDHMHYIVHNDTLDQEEHNGS